MIERRIQSSKLYTAVTARALGGLLKRGAGYPVALRLADAIGHVVGDKENRLFVVLRRSITGRRLLPFRVNARRRSGGYAARS